MATIILADGNPRDVWFNMRTAAHLSKQGVDLIEFGKKALENEGKPDEEKKIPGMDFFFYLVLEGLRTNPKYSGMTEGTLGDLFGFGQLEGVIGPVMQALMEFMGSGLVQEKKGGAEGNVPEAEAVPTVGQSGTLAGSSEPPPKPALLPASSGG